MVEKKFTNGKILKNKTETSFSPISCTFCFVFDKKLPIERSLSYKLHTKGQQNKMKTIEDSAAYKLIGIGSVDIVFVMAWVVFTTPQN